MLLKAHARDLRVTAWLGGRWMSSGALFVAIVLVGSGLRLGYAVARHQDTLTRTGNGFVLLWDHDALEHVLIAKSLLEDGAYRVGPDIEGKSIRYGFADALYKAPLYQYFLAGVFALSGFGFVLLVPLQAIIGGIGAGLAALIARDLFRSWRVAAFTGAAAAAHPLLVNSASQPYNENLFVALVLGSIWAFVRWTRTPRPAWVAAAGILAGLAILCRESALPSLLVMAGYAAVVRPAGPRRSLLAAASMAALAAALVAPWTVRNYVRTGAIVPVSAISGTALSIGNNECVAAAPLLSWYWAEEPCPTLNDRRSRLHAATSRDGRRDSVTRNRVNSQLAAAFIASRPLDYLKLSLQRAWTVLLPFHPRQRVGTVQRAALLVYWLAVVPAGLLALMRRERWRRPGTLLAGALIAAVIAPQILVYVAPDMRYRVPADPLLAALAATVYVEWLRRTARVQPAVRRGPHRLSRGGRGPVTGRPSSVAAERRVLPSHTASASTCCLEAR